MRQVVGLNDLHGFDVVLDGGRGEHAVAMLPPMTTTRRVLQLGASGMTGFLLWWHTVLLDVYDARGQHPRQENRFRHATPFSPRHLAAAPERRAFTRERRGSW